MESGHGKYRISRNMELIHLQLMQDNSATNATMEVVINNLITPIFTQIGLLCRNSTAPVLPASSTNSITGIWSPAVVTTSSGGSTTYTFTPDAAQCATVPTMDIVVSNFALPTFTAFEPLCQNSMAPTLPDRSTNSITGSWNPATIRIQQLSEQQPIPSPLMRGSVQQQQRWKS